MNAEPDVTLPASDHKKATIAFCFVCKALSEGHMLNGKEFYFSTRLPLHTDSVVREAFGWQNN